MEEEHVKAQRTKKEKENMSQFERFVTKATRRVTSWQKQEQCWTKDLWQKRKQKLCSRKERRCTQHCHAASFHCLVEQWKDSEELRPTPKEKWVFVEKKGENTKHRTERRAEADKYQGM